MTNINIPPDKTEHLTATSSPLTDVGDLHSKEYNNSSDSSREDPPKNSSLSSNLSLNRKKRKDSLSSHHGSKKSRRESCAVDEDGIIVPDRKRPIPHSLINTQDRSGRTLLFKYASRGDTETTESLLRAGASLRIADYAGWTPLHEACLEGHAEIVQLMLAYGADVDVNGGDGDTPLHDAIGNGHFDVVELLLRNGASIHLVNEFQQTPLEFAMEKAEDARSDGKRSKNKNGKDSDHAESVRIVNLLKTWSHMIQKVVKKDKSGQTVLHHACAAGDVEQVLKLLEYGADISATDNAGWTPLHNAAINGHASVVKVLLKYGADVDSLGMEMETPLHDAASNGFKECAEILLAYGAEPVKKNAAGKMAIDLAPPDAKDLIEVLNRPLGYWQPVKTPEFYPKLISNAEATTHAPAAEKRKSEPGTKSKANVPASNSNSSFAWGGLEQRQGPFESSREEKKFRALLKTIQKTEGGADVEIDSKQNIREHRHAGMTRRHSPPPDRNSHVGRPKVERDKESWKSGDGYRQTSKDKTKKSVSDAGDARSKIEESFGERDGHRHEKPRGRDQREYRREISQDREREYRQKKGRDRDFDERRLDRSRERDQKPSGYRRDSSRDRDGKTTELRFDKSRERDMYRADKPRDRVERDHLLDASPKRQKTFGPGKDDTPRTSAKTPKPPLIAKPFIPASIATPQPTKEKALKIPASAPQVSTEFGKKETDSPSVSASGIKPKRKKRFTIAGYQRAGDPGDSVTETSLQSSVQSIVSTPSVVPVDAPSVATPSVSKDFSGEVADVKDEDVKMESVAENDVVPIPAPLHDDKAENQAGNSSSGFSIAGLLEQQKNSNKSANTLVKDPPSTGSAHVKDLISSPRGSSKPAAPLYSGNPILGKRQPEERVDEMEKHKAPQTSSWRNVHGSKDSVTEKVQRKDATSNIPGSSSETRVRTPVVPTKQNYSSQQHGRDVQDGTPLALKTTSNEVKLQPSQDERNASKQPLISPALKVPAYQSKKLMKKTFRPESANSPVLADKSEIPVPFSKKTDARPPPRTPKPTPSKAAEPISKQVEISTYAIKYCFPLYGFHLKATEILTHFEPRVHLDKGLWGNPLAFDECKIFIDLQLAFCLGLKSGRQLLEKYPNLVSRVASSAEKAALESTEVSQLLLKTMYTMVNPSWVKSASINGKSCLKLVDLDVHIVLWNQDLYNLLRSHFKRLELDPIPRPIQWIRDIVWPRTIESKPIPKNTTSQGTYVHKLKRFKPQ